MGAEQPGTEVVDERHARRPCHLDELRGGGTVHEPVHPEVARVHAQDRAGPRLDRRPVVAGVRPVRRADLDQLGPGGPHDVGDAERPPDLDQLTAADRHTTVTGQGGQRQHEGTRTVVHRERRLGPGQAGERVADRRVPAAALAGVEVDLEVDGAGRGGHRRHRFDGQRRTTEVGVEQDAGGVDHRRELRRRAVVDRCQHPGDEDVLLLDAATGGDGPTGLAPGRSAAP
jgi:hypothetical protein